MATRRLLRDFPNFLAKNGNALDNSNYPCDPSTSKTAPPVKDGGMQETSGITSARDVATHE